MKAKLITLLLVAGMSLQAAAMGHPHNMFAARKQIQSKRVAMNQSPCTDSVCSKAVIYAKNTVVSTAAVWTWFSQKSAK